MAGKKFPTDYNQRTTPIVQDSLLIHNSENNQTEYVLLEDLPSSGTGSPDTAAQVKTKYESNADTNAFTNAEKSKLASQSGTNTGDQNISYNADTRILTLSNGGAVDLSTLLDNTDDQIITDLSLSGNVLSITLDRGNTVTLDLTPILGSNADGSETKINAGTNVTVTGLGTIASPYVINASGGGSTPLTNNLTTTTTGTALDAVQGKALKDLIDGISSGSGNPNVVPVLTVSDIVGVNKIFSIQADITLAANLTLPSGATIVDGGGKIITGSFSIIGDNTQKFYPLGDKVLFDVGATGNVTGLIPPQDFFITNFGAVNDGYDSGTGFVPDKSGTSSIDVATTPTVLTDANANFTGREGQKIVVMNGGNSASVENALITTIASVTNSTTVVLSDAAQNVGHFYSQISNGLDDINVTGTYTGTKNIVLKVEIDSQGTPDTFRWSRDNGVTWVASGVPVSTSPTLLEQGISVSWDATTGHDGVGTIDSWDVKGFNMSATRMFVGTDNYNQIKKALDIRNKKSGKLIFPEGHFITSTLKRAVIISGEQVGFLIGDGTDGVTLEGYGSKLQCFPFPFPNGLPTNQYRTDLLTPYKTKNSKVAGLKIVGSYFSAVYYTGNPAGVNIGTGAFNIEFVDCHVTEFQGDGFVCSGDGQQENGIQGTNQIGAAFDTGLSVGRLLPDGTIDLAQTNYIYSTDPVLISGGNFDYFREIADYGQFALTGGAISGWGGLTYKNYDISIYDDDDQFVAFIPNANFYEDIRIQGLNWKKARVGFKDVVNKEDVNLLLRSDFGSKGIRITNCEVSYNGRQGLSNGSSYMIIEGGIWHNNGGRSPGYGMDFEDLRRKSRNIIIRNVTFFDNAVGDIALIGTENVLIEGCQFIRNSRPNWANGAALNANYGRNVQLRNNFAQGRFFAIGRGGDILNLKGEDITINLNGLGCTLDGVYLDNGKIIIDGADVNTHNKQGINSIIRNVVIRQSRAYDFLFSDTNVLGQWENIRVFLNDASNVSNLIVGSQLDTSFKLDQELWAKIPYTAGKPYGGGYLDGFKVSGNLINENPNERSSYARFPQYEWTRGVEVDGIITLGYYGLGAKNILWENLKCNSLIIDARNGSYLTSVPADPIASPAPVWTFKNAEIINNFYNASDINYRQLKVNSQWLDVVFKNSKIINNFPYVSTANRSLFLEMDNYGSVFFIDTEIGNKGSEGATFGNDIAITNTWFRDAARTYPIIFENPNLIYDTAIIKRTVDVIRFNKTSKFLGTYAVYADDAAATTAGYPQGYMYTTATGELRFKL